MERTAPLSSAIGQLYQIASRRALWHRPSQVQRTVAHLVSHGYFNRTASAKCVKVYNSSPLYMNRAADQLFYPNLQHSLGVHHREGKWDVARLQ
ncbi:hypothetical protein Y032_0130g1569 [Ancylostoma ceylanicum]|uniref:Uncharacterized protein n=1 Tax=Ancylostoma ceylanicum TaxID=53326 RepID=A0A016T6P9_9BILA|nr:hypothetical protein Y032_0130g1569 [Ancylostoma ceylanicum]